MTIMNVLDLVALSTPRLAECASGQDVVFFIGNTRAGKSTIVSCLSGIQQEVVQISYGKQVLHIIQNVESGVRSPIIGIGASSVTIVPEFWPPKSAFALDAKLCDMPGFDDNRGEERDIVNAFCIKEVISHVKSAKFVLVSAINDLDSDNVSQFTSLLSKTSNLFGNKFSEDIIASISIVFTKGSQDLENEYITELIERDVLSVLKAHSNEALLAEHFVKHPELIGVFSLSQKESLPSTDSIVRAIKSTASSQHASLSQIDIPISKKSTAYLMNERANLLEMSCFMDLSSIYDSRLNQEYIGKILDTIHKTREAIKSKSTLCEVVSNITSDEATLYKAKCIEFLDTKKIQNSYDFSEFFVAQVARVIEIIESKVRCFETKQRYMNITQEIEKIKLEQDMLRKELEIKTYEYEDAIKHKSDAEVLHEQQVYNVIQIRGAKEVINIRLEAGKQAFTDLDNDVRKQTVKLVLRGKEEVTQAINSLAIICKMDDVESNNASVFKVLGFSLSPLSVLSSMSIIVAVPIVGHFAGIAFYPMLFESIKFVLEYRGLIAGAGAVILVTKFSKMYNLLSKEKQDITEAAKHAIEIYRIDPTSLATIEANIESLKISLLAAQDRLNHEKSQLDLKQQEVRLAEEMEGVLLGEIERRESFLIDIEKALSIAKKAFSESTEVMQNAYVALESEESKIAILESTIKSFAYEYMGDNTPLRTFEDA